MIRYAFPILLLAAQSYLFIRFLRWHQSIRKLPQQMFYAVAGLFILFNAALVGTLFMRVLTLRYSNGFVNWVVYPFLFWHSSTFVIALVLLLGAIVRLPFATFWRALRWFPATKERAAAIAAHPQVVHFDETRRRFLRRGIYGLTAASFGGTGYGMLVEKEECDITEQEMRIPGLPPEWNGFTIGLVSDIHSSMYMRKKEMDEYVRRLNDLGTDLIAVGGDLVNSSVDEVYPFAEAFSKLHAPMGVFGILGNHDYYSGDPETVARVASEAGIHMLRDEGITLKRNGRELLLLGVDDTGTSADATQKIRQSMADLPKNTARVLLCHRPYYFKDAASLGIDVMLSGHTHGGQLVFGRIGNTAFTPAILASPYVSGHYREGAAQMYVSRGIGTVAVPVRINCPPELTRIILRPA
jgi:predicted MPP superfamily phosphohydrolase